MVVATAVLSAAAIGAGTLQDVVAVRVLRDECFDSFVEVGQLTRACATENLLTLGVVSDHLAVFNFQVLPERGLNHVSRNSQLVGDELRAGEAAADLLGIQLLLEGLRLAGHFVQLELEGFTDFGFNLLDFTGIHQCFGVEIGYGCQGFFGCGRIVNALKSLYGLLSILGALAVALGFGVQARDGGHGARSIKCHLFAVVMDIDRLAILQNRVAVFIELQLHFVSLGHPASCRAIRPSAPRSSEQTGNKKPRQWPRL